jgi:hypothetical protein
MGLSTAEASTQSYCFASGFSDPFRGTKRSRRKGRGNAAAPQARRRARLASPTSSRALMQLTEWQKSGHRSGLAVFCTRQPFNGQHQNAEIWDTAL